MAIKNVGGHGISSVMSGTDHVAVKAAQPPFPKAPTDNGGMNFGSPAAAKGKGSGPSRPKVVR